MMKPHDPAPPGIALFDLDGTLLPWDCQIVFRHQVIRREPIRGLSLGVFLLFAPLCKLLGDRGMKRVFLCYLWKMPPEDLENHAEQFAEAASSHAYPQLIEALHRHKNAGHLTILTSASPESYVRKIGEKLGFDIALGTEVEYGSFFPDLENHKGKAKVERLHTILPKSWWDKNGRLPNSHGYTDSTADLPLLEICEQATLVNPNHALTQLGTENNWQIVRPSRPWRSSIHRLVRLAAMLLGLKIDPWTLGSSQ